MGTTWRAAVVGCGKIGWEFQDDPGAARFGICSHASAWDAVDGVELVAVSDVDAGRAQRCAERWRVPFWSGALETLLEGARPEIVSIATPDEQHFAGIKRCLEFPSVRAVLAEKPLAMTLSEAEELEALSQLLGKVLVVNYSRRFCPFYAELGQRIHSDEFGPLRLARNVYTKGVRHNGSHFIDLMNFLMGSLSPAGARRPAWLQGDPLDPDPGLDLWLTSPDGASVVMNHLPGSQFTIFEFDLCFERARFTFTEGGDTVHEYVRTADVPFAGYTSLTHAAVHEHVMRDYVLHAANHVVEVLNGGTNVSPGRASVQLMGCYQEIFASLG